MCAVVLHGTPDVREFLPMSRLAALRSDHVGVSWRLEPGVKVIAPPPGLASGRREIPAWAIGLIGVLMVTVAFGWVAYRVRQRRKDDA
jgi:hypothetical protein